MNLSTIKRLTIALLTVFGVLAIMVTGYTFLTMRQSQKGAIPQSSQPNPSPQTLRGVTPTSSPQLIYQGSSQEQIINKTKDHPALQESDITAKTKLKALANPNTGIVNTNSDFEISYIPTFDLIQVELRSTDIESAKQAAENYLLGVGFSKQGVCDFPTQFYLNQSVATQLPNNSPPFKQTADWCP